MVEYTWLRWLTLKSEKYMIKQFSKMCILPLSKSLITKETQKWHGLEKINEG